MEMCCWVAVVLKFSPLFLLFLLRSYKKNFSDYFFHYLFFMLLTANFAGKCRAMRSLFWVLCQIYCA